MAGFNYRITTKGSRDKSPTVAVCFFLSLLVLFPGSASSDYRIVTREHQISTSSYWVQGEKLYLHEGGELPDLTEITSITEESCTPLDAQMDVDALKRFYCHISWLQGIEDEIFRKQDNNLKALQTIDTLGASDTSSSKIKKAVKAFCGDLDDLEREVSRVKHYWDQMRMPQLSLVLARDIKSLQLMSLQSCIEHMRRYVKTWDPTYREYAKEYARQAMSFDQSFYDALHREKRYKE